MNYKVNLNLSQNELQNARIHNLGSAPSNPVTGQVYFNTADKCMYVFDSTTWQELTNLSIQDITSGINNGTNNSIELTALPESVQDAVAKKHTQNTDKGTSNSDFYIGGTNGVHLKNNSSNLEVRNGSSLSNFKAQELTIEGPTTIKGNLNLGTSTNTHIIKSLLTSIQTSGKFSDSGADNKNVFEIFDASNGWQDKDGVTHAGAKKLFEVKQNGDTVIGGNLTVSGTGTSQFAGDVNIGGRLDVTEGIGGASLALGENLTLEGDLVVKGKSSLGDNAAQDTIIIKGLTTIHTDSNKATIDTKVATYKTSNTNATIQEIQTYKNSLPEYKDTFNIIDSIGASLFSVKGNGDTIIAGVINVNGDGTSQFAGDVNIGGRLNVVEGIDSGAKLDLGDDLTLAGDLVVKGKSTLGDNATEDTTTIKGVTEVITGTTKAAGLATKNAFKIKSSDNQELFAVKQNGDTVIGGILTVNGTGDSSFTGNVNIGGKLTVKESATVTGEMSGDSLTLTGNLDVKGNSTLGNEASDKTTIIGVAILPENTTIGDMTKVQIKTAVNKMHNQNTDTGTSSDTFQLGGVNASSGGVIIRSDSGELQVRNKTNNGFADIRVNKLFVEGEQTIIASNEVNIGDSEILLNSDVNTAAVNSGGGLAVKRLKSDNVTRADAKITFNNTRGRWETIQGDVGATVTTTLPSKLTASVGNGSATSFTITHNLDSRDLNVSMRETATPYEMIMADVEFTTEKAITVHFGSAPSTNQYTVTIIG